MKYKIYISPEDRASNVYASSALWNGHTTNEKEQMGRCADYMERGLLRCGSFEVINAQYGNMYDRVKESNNWPADMHIAPHTNGFNGKAAGTRVHCYPSDRSRRIGKLIQDRIGPLSPGAPDFLVEDDRLYELRAPYMVAVLPEFAFHDNPEDAQWLVDNMVRIAEETVQAICEYFGVAYVPPVEDDNGAPAEPITPEEKPQENALYRVQIGAFRVRANAEAFRAKAEAAGFDGAYIVKVEE
jgi:N-acetylmuramoyl-L-alanine amidase